MTVTKIDVVTGLVTITDDAAPSFTPTLSAADVFAERVRRIEAGTTINVTGHGNVQLAGTFQTRADLQALATAAQLRLAAGDTTTTTRVRGTDGTIHTLTPAQILDLWSKGAAFIQGVTDASWLIEAMDPIPVDYAANSRWTT